MNKTFEFLKHKTQVNFISTIDRDYFVRYTCTEKYKGTELFQSFAEGEVTPEQCHAIGVRLAEEMWKDRFEVIVSTHLNSNHYHNHFVINSVSFKDGKRYYDKRETYAELRRLSDSLCEEYGLSVIQEKPCRNSKINYANYQKNTNNKVNYYSIAKENLDKEKINSYNLEWLEHFKNIKKLDKIDRNIVDSYISNIYVNEDGSIDIIFRYNEQYKIALEYLKTQKNMI